MVKSEYPLGCLRGKGFLKIRPAARGAVSRETKMDKNNKKYENPIEQVMFILGLKRDPKFETSLHAIKHGANPGVMNALDEFEIYAAIDANFVAFSKTIKNLQDVNLTPQIKEEVYKIILEELDEKHYGGRWFDIEKIIPKNWVSMRKYSDIFIRGNTVFCLPGPYLTVLNPILST